MAQVINLLELQLLSGTVYWSTAETLPDGSAVLDGSSNVYEARLKPYPKIQRKLSDAFFGIPEDGTLTCVVGALDQSDVTVTGEWDQAAGTNAIASLFRSTDARGRRAILRRILVSEDGTTTLSDRFYGMVEDRQFQEDGSVELRITDQSADVLDTPYPRLVIGTDLFPKATDERFAVGSTIPIHLGAHREHSPCRYVEGTDRLAWAAAEPRLYSQHRYLVGCDLAAANGYANVQPHVNALYLGADTGASLINPGEYAIRYDRRLTMSTPSISLLAGGSLTAAAYTYEVTAWNGLRESSQQTVSRTLTAGEVSANTRTHRLSWSRVDGAIGYFIRRNTFLLAVIGGINGSTASFDDTGTLTPISYDSASVTNLTGQNFFEAVFEGAVISKTDELVPVLADVECTEMGWQPEVSGLWHFRGNDGAAIHDSKPERNHYLRRSTTVGFWAFKNNGNSQLASNVNPLTITGATPGDYVANGKNGKPCLLGDGIITGTLTDAAQNGNLDRGTSTTLIAAMVRPDRGSSSRADMTLVEKGGPAFGVSGYNLVVDKGCAQGSIGDGVTEVTVRGTTPLDGAWHLVELCIDRTSQTLYLRVDGAVDSPSPSIAAVGSISNSADFTVLGGFGHFYGAIDWLLVDTALAPLTNLQNGKANSSLSAYNIETSTNQLPLYIEDGSQSNLDSFGTITVEFWGMHTVSPGGTLKTAVTKYDAAVGGYKLGLINSSGDKFQVVMNNIGTATTVTGSTTVTQNVWHYFAVVQSGTGVTLYQDGEVVGSATGSASGGDNTQPFIIGADTTAGSNRFPGAIDEVRVTQRDRTQGEIREAYYLGMRNPVRQLRTLLVSSAHGPGGDINVTTWDQAEADVAAAGSSKLATDIALVEPQRLRDYVTELAKVRGLRLAFSSAGTIDCVADTQKSELTSFGWQDGGIAAGSMKSRPQWGTRSIREAPKTLRTRYRRRRGRDGSLNRFLLKSSERSVLAVGMSDAISIDLAAVRETEAGDRVAYYYQQRAILADVTCEFGTGGDGLSLALGSVVRLYDPSSGITSTGDLHEVVALSEQGSEVEVSTRSWSSAIYSYSAGTLPYGIGAESEADYSATLPPSILGLGVTFAATVAAHGQTIWTPTASWTAPSSTNVALIVVEFRPSAETPWRSLGIFRKGTTSAKGDANFNDSTAYEFRIYARSKFGLDGPATQVAVSTALPGAPTNPDTAGSPGSWAITLSATGSGHRSRGFKWAKHPASNIDYYEWETYAASSGGSVILTGQTRSHRIVIQEAGLARGTARYIQVRAVNKSGQVSAYSARVSGGTPDAVTGGSTGDLGNNGTVDTGDAGTDAFTKVGSTTGAVVVTGSGFTSVISRAQATAGGIVVVNFTGLVNFFTGWTATNSLQIEVRKNSVQQTTAEYGGLNTDAAAQGITLPMSFDWIDTSPGTTTNTYELRGRVSLGDPSQAAFVDLRCTVMELKR